MRPSFISFVFPTQAVNSHQHLSQLNCPRLQLRIQFNNVSVPYVIVCDIPHMTAMIPSATILLLNTVYMLSNYPTLIMERIVPHRSTQRRRGGNHPFVWVSVCNDFSLLLPSDLHVVCKRVCVVVYIVEHWPMNRLFTCHGGRNERCYHL